MHYKYKRQKHATHTFVCVCRNVCTGICIYTHVDSANIHGNNHVQVLFFKKIQKSKTVICPYHGRNHGSTLPTLKGMYVYVIYACMCAQVCAYTPICAHGHNKHKHTSNIVQVSVFALQIQKAKTCNTYICVYVCRNVCTGICIYTHVHMANIHGNNHLQVFVFKKIKFENRNMLLR